MIPVRPLALPSGIRSPLSTSKVRAKRRRLRPKSFRSTWTMLLPPLRLQSSDGVPQHRAACEALPPCYVCALYRGGPPGRPHAQDRPRNDDRHARHITRHDVLAEHLEVGHADGGHPMCVESDTAALWRTSSTCLAPLDASGASRETLGVSRGKRRRRRRPLSRMRPPWRRRASRWPPPPWATICGPERPCVLPTHRVPGPGCAGAAARAVQGRRGLESNPDPLEGTGAGKGLKDMSHRGVRPL